MSGVKSFNDSPTAFSKVSFIVPNPMEDADCNRINLQVNDDIIETIPPNISSMRMDDKYNYNRRQSLDDGLILSLRRERPSSGDSGIDKLTSGVKPDAVRRLTGSFPEGSGSFNSLPTVAEKRKSIATFCNRVRHTTSNSAKSLPEIPRMSLDLGFLNASSYTGKRRNTTVSMFYEGSDVFEDEATTEEEKRKHLRRNLPMVYSGIYAVLVVVLGGVLNGASQFNAPNVIYSEAFSMTLILFGMFWLMFLQIDLNRYKRFVLDCARMQHENTDDNISTTTETVFNQSWLPDNTKPSYFFLRGRHSGSFYLKGGMAAFCFGHLINTGLMLSQQVVYFMNDDKSLENCAHVSSIVLATIRPIYSFYQLFMVFKYSNIIINRNKAVARFGLMHCIATCLCFWFNTIVEDAFVHYEHLYPRNSTIDGVKSRPTASECANGTIFSSEKMEAIPYLYPFTIEYNLLLAGVWFIVWQNIGHYNAKADPHHFEHKVSHLDGNDVTYQSNLVISADCHSANKGLFAGLFLLLVIIVSVIVFFVTMNHEDTRDVGVLMYSLQEMTLSVLALVGIAYAFKQLMKLDINTHPVTFLDDVLLFIPLPFFFANNILSAIAELNYENYIRVAVHVLVSLQVIIQTPFIIDGLRRCSNAKNLRYKKPGREVVTFLIILNLSTWIINTFEHKIVDQSLSNKEYFGDLVSVFIGHTTHPMMLFYRFHSSVCLADIWKSAYEKGDH